jgi:FtsP/CotA-like multicopper oxidase with cupredoxin domain
MDRRAFIQTAFANLGALALGARLSSYSHDIQGRPPEGSDSRLIQAPPERGGALREFSLNLEPTQFELPARGIFEKWLYNGQFPGTEIRAKEGERLRLTVKNGLPEGTTIHWHGIPLRNAMDGVPDITQPAIVPGGTFVYEFDAAPAGSFLYHSHFGLQPERGLIGPLIVEEKKPHVEYDREYTLCLNDFLSGPPVPLGRSLNAGSGMPSMLMPPYFTLLINGRPPEAPAVFSVKTGERVRLRLINLSGATIYRFAIGGHPLIVTHTDGRPVEPLRVDALHLGPGERYDVLVEAKSPGAWPIAAPEVGGEGGAQGGPGNG